MEDDEIKRFVEKVKLESTYRKFIKSDIIYKLINVFDVDYEKQSYPKKIENPLKIALKFYKDYNKKYYDMILKGIENKRITIIQNYGESFIDSENNNAIIRLRKNDGDLFVLVHELAHFIDKNSNPSIISDEYYFLSEVFSFYMEKKLEIWLKDKKYQDLISVRKNNRIYFESKFLKVIENELYYEELYKEKGKIEKNDIVVSKIKSIIQYDISNIVNYLLMYPVANILSDYLVDSDFIENDNKIVEICLNINLYEMLKDCSIKEKYKKLHM